MSTEPRVIRLKLADGDDRVFTAIEVPDATKVEGADWLGIHARAIHGVGEGLSVLIVGTDDIAAIDGRAQ